MGVLRLDAQRVIISLFGQHEQHVLTEDTWTLILQNDIHNKAHYELWIGNCTISYDRSFCKADMNPPTNVPKASDRIFVSTDLLQDDTFKDRLNVVSFPHICFLTSSSIISPKGIVIVAYTILDDKPHDPPDTGYTRVFGRYINYRDGLSKHEPVESPEIPRRAHAGRHWSFLEGKGSLRSTWLTETEDTQTPSEENDNEEGHVNQEQKDKQTFQDVSKFMSPNATPSHLPFRPHNLHLPGNRNSEISGEQKKSSDMPTTGKKGVKARSRPKKAYQVTSAAKDQSTQLSPRDNFPSKVKEAFARGANLIRESIEFRRSSFSKPISLPGSSVNFRRH